MSNVYEWQYKAEPVVPPIGSTDSPKPLNWQYSIIVSSLPVSVPSGKHNDPPVYASHLVNMQFVTLISLFFAPVVSPVPKLMAPP